MGQTGMDVQLSNSARQLFPFAVEAKNLASFAGYKYYEQAKANSKELTPIVVVKANRKDPLVILDLKDFIGIIKK